MDVTTLEAPLGAAAAGARVAGRPTPPVQAPGRPGRRAGRGTGPQARPARSLAGGTRVLRPRACAVEVPTDRTATGNAGWRLTERGIALVLVTGLLIVTAALTVVGLTALRVTGERYAGSYSVLVQP
jgi:hypothetical protein